MEQTKAGIAEVHKKKVKFFLENLEGFGIVAIFFVALFDSMTNQAIFKGDYSQPILAALLFIGIRFIRMDVRLKPLPLREDESTISMNEHIQLIETQIKRIVTNSLTLYHTPTGEKNYSIAIEKLLTAKKVQATYFFRSSWESKPFLENVKAKYDDYYKKLDDRVSKGLLHYEWIVLVDTPEKITHLLNRIDYLCGMEDCVNKGYTKLRVIYQKPYVARMNFQINDDHSVILSIAGNTEELDTGAVITHEPFYKDMKKLYRKIWDDVPKIIDSGIHWGELTKLISSIDKSKLSEIEKLKHKHPHIINA